MSMTERPITKFGLSRIHVRLSVDSPLRVEYIRQARRPNISHVLIQFIDHTDVRYVSTSRQAIAVTDGERDCDSRVVTCLAGYSPSAKSQDAHSRMAPESGRPSMPKLSSRQIDAWTIPSHRPSVWVMSPRTTEPPSSPASGSLRSQDAT